MSSGVKTWPAAGWPLPLPVLAGLVVLDAGAAGVPGAGAAGVPGTTSCSTSLRFTTPVRPCVRKSKSSSRKGMPGVNQLKKVFVDFGTVASPLVSTSYSLPMIAFDNAAGATSVISKLRYQWHEFPLGSLWHIARDVVNLTVGMASNV